jgi:type III pantothenate kinase
MNIIFGDIGNTLTKICLVKNKKFIIDKTFYFKSSEILSKKLLSRNLKKIFNNKFLYKVAIFSSVSPKYELVMKNFFKDNYKVKIIEIKKSPIQNLIKINIKNKNQVGSDRIANAIGALKKYKANCIILDFGTATTFDVVTKDGFYNGGVIAPGVSLSLKSLISSADQIPKFVLEKQNKVVGKNTLEALRSGFYWGYTGLINNIIFKIEKETKKKYKVIFTGGYAELFKTSIIRPFKIDKNITINGIIEIFKTNKNYFI